MPVREPFERALALDDAESAVAILLLHELVQRARLVHVLRDVCGNGIGRTLPWRARLAPNFSCLIAAT